MSFCSALLAGGDSPCQGEDAEPPGGHRLGCPGNSGNRQEKTMARNYERKSEHKPLGSGRSERRSGLSLPMKHKKR